MNNTTSPQTRQYELGGGWGNRIQWSDPSAFDKPFDENTLFKCLGWKRRIPRAGDTLRAEFQKSWITFEFVLVEPYFDPPDMFKATVRPVAQEMKP